MEELTFDEARVLGVLIEKGMTTPGQYPMTVNAIVAGCNQKNNREPVVELDEQRVTAALDGLREKRLVVEAYLEGTRTLKYRHRAQETLELGGAERALIAELLLRGAQTVGQLRERASRMRSIASRDEAEAALQGLAQHETPLVRALPPSPGSRAPRYAQLLAAEPATAEAPVASQGDGDGLAARVERLEAEVERLRAHLAYVSSELGLTEPTAEAADREAGGG